MWEGMHRRNSLAAALFGLVAAGAGCGGAAQHPLLLVAPTSECDAMTGKCTYLGCADLGITELHIEVGLFSRETVTVPCPESLSSGQATVMVPYQPGQDFYLVDASFPREGATVYLTSGPFSEDHDKTPWKLLLR
jgi:hypothetical protein